MLLILSGLVFLTVYGQELQSESSSAFLEFKQISDSMTAIFPEDELQTYRRSSYSDAEMQNYLSLHVQRLDLLKSIKGRTQFVLDNYLHSGNWFHEVGFPKESIKSYLHFFDYFQKHHQELSLTQHEHYKEMRSYARSMLAESYAKLGAYDDAEEQHKTNVAFTKPLNYIYHPSALNNYGLFFYWYKNKPDTAMTYFKSAYRLTQAHHPLHSLNGSLRDNMADIYRYQNDYQNAAALYAENFKFYQTARNEKTLLIDLPRLVSAGAQSIEANIYLNRLDTAQITFNKLSDIVRSPPQNQALSATTQLEYLNAKEQLLSAQNRIKEAYKVVKTVQTISDSLKTLSEQADKKWRAELNAITLSKIGLDFKIDQLQKEKMIKAQRVKLWFIGILSSVFIVILVLLIFNRRQHLINAKNKQLLAEQTLENTALKIEQLNSEIKSKERDLSDFALKLTQDQDWAKNLAHQLDQISKATGEERSNLFKTLSTDIKNKITVDSDTQAFFERLDKLSDAFYSKLIAQFPNLSKNEIRLCSLIRLKIESRSIATLQNITLASLNTSRYRLRKKLQLSEDNDLDLFIQNL
ncbi:hypothetical protein [Winogradskyella rapida]|uniref:Tetratricopeptide repeat protein n=1 Tax=Winogradskyella rapida TaxID=549701 RepID=A0ABW3KLL5_9FLAO